MRVWISKNHYGHWKAVCTGANPGEVIDPAPSPAFLTRDGAVNYARSQWPALDLVIDGETKTDGDPPPLPRIDALAEARAAGLPIA